MEPDSQCSTGRKKPTALRVKGRVSHNTIQINQIMINLLNLHKVNEFENKAVEFGKLNLGGLGHLTLECNMVGRCRCFKNLCNLFGENSILIHCFRKIRSENNRVNNEMN